MSEIGTSDKIEQLNVFISHAAEDTELARVLQKSIENSCDASRVDVFLDYDHIAPGLELAKTIKDALAKCDFFIGIATENVRNQFSWCGLELGYYLATQNSNTHICYLFHQEIIDLFRPYAGTKIVSFTEEQKQTIKSPIQKADSSPIYQLLVQIGNEAARRSFPRNPIKYFDSLKTSAEVGAGEVTGAYVTQIKRNASTAKYPQSRIKVSLFPQDNAVPDGGLSIDNNTIVSVDAKTGRVLHVSDEPEGTTTEMTWSAFSETMTRLSGGPHLPLILRDIIEFFLSDPFTRKNDYLFTAPDNHSYRVILVRQEMFGDSHREFVFNLIETLFPLAGGDPRTSLISSAIVVATQFRSLFIEQDATYSKKSLSSDLLNKAKGMVRDLRRIHIEAATLRLDDKDGLKKALGSTKQVDDWFAEWWPPVEKLQSAAIAFSTSNTETNKALFLEAHSELVESTGEINRQFTSKCLDVYKDIIDGN